MRISNDSIVPTNKSMAASFNSSVIPTSHIGYLTIQAVWTGSPVGTFKIQTSQDLGTDEAGSGVTNWTDYTGSTATCSGAADDVTWLVTTVGERWFRVVYTATSGSGTVNIRFNAKGF